MKKRAWERLLCALKKSRNNVQKGKILHDLLYRYGFLSKENAHRIHKCVFSEKAKKRIETLYPTFF